MSTLTAVQKQIEGAAEMQAAIMTEQVKLSLKEINTLEVKDESTNEIMKSNVQLVKKTIKQIAGIRTSFTKPIDEKKKKIVELERTIIQPLVEADALAQKKINAYVTALAKQAAAEERRLRELQMKKEQFKELLLSFVNDTMNDFAKAIHVKKASALKSIYDNRLNTKLESSHFSKLASQYPDRANDLEIAANMLMHMGSNLSNYVKDLINKDKVKALLEQTQVDLEEKFQLALDNVGEVEEEQMKERTSTIKKAQKGIYHNISFNVTNMEKVPDEYMMKVINDTMVKVFISEHKDKIIAGDAHIPGIEFIVEQKVRG